MSAIATTAHGVDTVPGLDHDFRVLGFGPIGVTGAVVALAIDYTGRKHPVGLIAGSTENARVVTDLLADLGGRALDTTRPPRDC